MTFINPGCISHPPIEVCKTLSFQLNNECIYTLRRRCKYTPKVYTYVTMYLYSGRRQIKLPTCADGWSWNKNCAVSTHAESIDLPGDIRLFYHLPMAVDNNARLRPTIMDTVGVCGLYFSLC